MLPTKVIEKRRILLRCDLVAIGTERPSRNDRPMSAFGYVADMDRAVPNVAF
jgi:hypothetical protein